MVTAVERTLTFTDSHSLGHPAWCLVTLFTTHTDSHPNAEARETVLSLQAEVGRWHPAFSRSCDDRLGGWHGAAGARRQGTGRYY